MNEIINKLLLAGDNFMPEWHLRQPGYIYSVCGTFTKNKTRYSRYIYQKKLNNACFHVMTYGDFKDLIRRTDADKVLRDKAIIIAKNLKYDGYQRQVVSMLINSFDKKISDGAVKIEIMSNKELLAQELDKPIIRKFEKRKVHSSFIDNIGGDDLDDTQLISKLIKGF